MRTAIILALLLAAGSAQAKLAPLDEPVPVTAISAEDTTIMAGPAGAMLESNYFNAPQPRAGIIPCRLQPDLFQKARLARPCD
ncbi:MAG TPA: hypothetical protein VGC38_01400 [Pseudolabrys sp.]